MTRTIRTRSRQSLRSRLHVERPLPAAVAGISEPAHRGDADAYTWAVNAAVESGETARAYEIAAEYRP